MYHAINDYQQQRNVSGVKTGFSFGQAFQANQPSYIELGDSEIEQPEFYRSFSKKASLVNTKSAHDIKKFLGVSDKGNDVQKQLISAPASHKFNINLIIDVKINAADSQDEEENQTTEISSPSSISQIQEMEDEANVEVDPEDYCKDFTPEINLYRGQYEKSAAKVEKPLMGQKRTFGASAVSDDFGAFSMSKDGKRAKTERQSTIDEMLWDSADESDFEEEELELPDLGNLTLRRTQASVYMDIRNKCLYL